MVSPIELVERVIESTITHLTEGVVVALPRIASAMLVLVLAFFAIKAVSVILRHVLSHAYQPEESLIIDLSVILVSVFLWFGVALTLLKVLGLDEIAASVGTAVGFIALGVSYALSEMIEDTVSGVYLLRDPDFNAGDLIKTKSMSGEVLSIGLRKSRFRTAEGDIAILANRNVESDWTRRMGTSLE